jgi:hypothetical protein
MFCASPTGAASDDSAWAGSSQVDLTDLFADNFGKRSKWYDELSVDASRPEQPPHKRCRWDSDRCDKELDALLNPKPTATATATATATPIHLSPNTAATPVKVDVDSDSEFDALLTTNITSDDSRGDAAHVEFDALLRKASPACSTSFQLVLDAMEIPHDDRPGTELDSPHISEEADMSTDTESLFSDDGNVENGADDTDTASSCASSPDDNTPLPIPSPPPSLIPMPSFIPTSIPSPPPSLIPMPSFIPTSIPIPPPSLIPMPSFIPTSIPSQPPALSPLPSFIPMPSFIPKHRPPAVAVPPCPGCVPSTHSQLYTTQPSISGEKLNDFAIRGEHSADVLKSYNPRLSEESVLSELPAGICYATWEQDTTASSFHITSNQTIPSTRDHTEALTNHASGLHALTGGRIAMSSAFVPEGAPELTARLLATHEIRLPRQMSLQELRYDNMKIDFDKIARNPTEYPAFFKNSRRDVFLFFFEKFLTKGNCKGTQKLIQLGTESDKEKRTVYVNSQGLSPHQVVYKEGTLLPCLHRGRPSSSVSCAEHTVCVEADTLQPLDARLQDGLDTRPLFHTSVIGGIGGALYTHTTPPSSTEMVRVGWFTQTASGITCATRFSCLAQIFTTHEV